MFILDKPYVSDFLQHFLVKSRIKVLRTDVVSEMKLSGDFNFIEEDDAIEKIKYGSDFRLYTNSENSINWIVNNLDFTELPDKIDIFKDKVRFRKILKNYFPDLFFREVSFNELDKLDINKIPKPFVIKPAVGFFSLGVHMVGNDSQWNCAVENIKKEIDYIKGIYPVEVINTARYIIEEVIEGTEYAVDAYYNNTGEPVILNILKHYFSSGEDVSDRVYVSSKKIIENKLDEMTDFLKTVGTLTELKNFPLHFEVRISEEKGLQPIEINPLRFGGWCTTADMTALTYGLNPYEYYYENKKPAWGSILDDLDDKLFTVIVLDNSTGYNGNDIKSFDYVKLLSQFDKPVELRRVNHKKFPLFGFLFTETTENHFRELEKILHSDLTEYITLEK